MPKKRWERGFPTMVTRERDKRGWTQKDLAQAGDMYQSLVSRVERGQRPSMESVEKFSDGFGIEVSELIAMAEAVADELDDEDEQGRAAA